MSIVTLQVFSRNGLPETKGSKEDDRLRSDEARKIHCGKRHFKEALGVGYEVVTKAEEISNFVIR